MPVSEHGMALYPPVEKCLRCIFQPCQATTGTPRKRGRLAAKAQYSDLRSSFGVASAQWRSQSTQSINRLLSHSHLYWPRKSTQSATSPNLHRPIRPRTAGRCDASNPIRTVADGSAAPYHGLWLKMMRSAPAESFNSPLHCSDLSFNRL